MVHHSLTPDGDTVSWPAIEKYHRETNGWRDIGYHAGIELVTGNPDLDQYKYQALIGRPVMVQASACPQGDMNRFALHVCCVGNFDLVAPSLKMLTVLVERILLPWMSQFGISYDHIVGHRDFNPAKTCPGTRFDLDGLRRMVR
jgi:hypothetical protein